MPNETSNENVVLTDVVLYVSPPIMVIVLGGLILFLSARQADRSKLICIQQCRIEYNQKMQQLHEDSILCECMNESKGNAANCAIELNYTQKREAIENEYQECMQNCVASSPVIVDPIRNKQH